MQQTQEEQREIKLFLKAKKLTPAQYGDEDMVYLDRVGKILVGNEGYFHNVEALQESIADSLAVGEIKLEDLPQYCWGCDRVPMTRWEASDLIERCTEDLHEDAADRISDESIAALDVALKVFYDANPDVYSFEVSSKKVVLLEWSWLPKALGDKWEAIAREASHH
jgi:hypothetical protein